MNNKELTAHLLAYGGVSIGRPPAFDPEKYYTSPFEDMRETMQHLEPAPKQALVMLIPTIDKPDDDGVMVFVHNEGWFAQIQDTVQQLSATQDGLVRVGVRERAFNDQWFEFPLSTSENIEKFRKAMGAVRMGRQWTD
jgi:hypothetical protein